MSESERKRTSADLTVPRLKPRDPLFLHRESVKSDDGWWWVEWIVCWDIVPVWISEWVGLGVGRERVLDGCFKCAGWEEVGFGGGAGVSVSWVLDGMGLMWVGMGLIKGAWIV